MASPRGLHLGRRTARCVLKTARRSLTTCLPRQSARSGLEPLSSHRQTLRRQVARAPRSAHVEGISENSHGLGLRGWSAVS